MSPTTPTIEVTLWDRKNCCPGEKSNIVAHHFSAFTHKNKHGKPVEGAKVYTSETTCVYVAETKDQLAQKIKGLATSNSPPGSPPFPRPNNPKNINDDKPE